MRVKKIELECNNCQQNEKRDIRLSYLNDLVFLKIKKNEIKQLN